MPLFASAPSGRDIENADQLPRRIVDVKKLLVGREAEAVRLIEEIVVDQELRRPAGAGHAVDALKAKLMGPFDAVMGRAAVDGIGEIDRPVRPDADVVGRVELLAAEMRSENLAPPVRALAHEQRRRVLADDEVEVGVIGHAVAFVGGPLRLGDAMFRVPAAAHVARHVGEQEIVVERMPDRPFGEHEPGPDWVTGACRSIRSLKSGRKVSWLIRAVPPHFHADGQRPQSLGLNAMRASRQTQLGRENSPPRRLATDLAHKRQLV